MLEGFDPDAVAEIRARLDLVRRSGVKILFAIESGSRAWGFPSPDSDYDCRFVYVWPASDHLVLRAQRDVIEFPIEGEIDAGGWDLRKALLLALKGNAAILEWVKSPHAYEEVAGFRHNLLDVLNEIAEPELVARHYLGLLKRHDPTAADSHVRLKKLFYAIRPALSLYHMEERGFRELPPMDMQSLMSSVKLAPDLAELIDAMTEIKKTTREMGTGPVPDVLARFLDEARQHFDALLAKTGATNAAGNKERFAVAERFYRRTVLDIGA
jgi:predicted nucleotidyltransferase